MSTSHKLGVKVKDSADSQARIIPVDYTNRKLSIEVVPKTLWGKNLHNGLGRKEWDRVRRVIYAKYNYACSVCGARDATMTAHEVWSYDDNSHIQTLANIMCLCQLCHWVKHYGLAQLRAMESKLDLSTVIEHYKTVNECTRFDFDCDKSVAMLVHKERSRHAWQQVIGDYNRFLF